MSAAVILLLNRSKSAEPLPRNSESRCRRADRCH